MSYYSSDDEEPRYYEDLRKDLATEKELSIENFAKAIFIRGDWVDLVDSPEVREVLNDATFKSLLKGCTESTDGVDPVDSFTRLANYVLATKRTKKPSTLNIKFFRNYPSPIAGSTDIRRPHIVIANSDANRGHRVNRRDEPLFHWTDVMSCVEFKIPSDTPTEEETYESASAGIQSSDGEQISSSADKPSETESQAEPAENSPRIDPDINVKLRSASYATEMMSNGVLRTHAIAFYIDGHDICFQYFDRSIIVSSVRFSFKEEPSKLVALIFTLDGLNEKKWGCMSGFESLFSSLLMG